MVDPLDYYRGKGKVTDIEWDKNDIPEGANDVPVELMVNKILNILEKK